MNFIYLISREWSAKILHKLINDKSIKFKKKLVFYTDERYIKKINLLKNEKKKIKIKNLDNHIRLIKKFNPNIIFAFGWNEFLSKKIRKIAPCFILHPSKLPKFRGGSPIQNQLIRGVKASAVSIIMASDNIDSGDIFFQKKISFTGYLEDIHKEIISKGFYGAKIILDNFSKKKLNPIKQNENLATFYKRRTPDMSEIHPSDFKKYNAEFFYNFIRGLQKPYPEVFIKCKDNSKLYFEKVYFKNN